MSELEERWRDLGEFIREQRRVGHLSLRKLSEMAGISNPYLSQIERGLRKPSAEILQQIARALEISSETLYVRAGILEAREGEADVLADIRDDLWLSEEQKRTLVQIYETFRAERIALGFGPPPESDDLDDHADPDAAEVLDDEVEAAGSEDDPDDDPDDDLDDEESGALAGRS